MALVTMPEVPSIPTMERDMSGSEKPSFSGALAVGRKLDLPLPDSPAVRDAYDQAEAESQGFGRVKYPSAPHNESWRPLARALQAFAIESHICNMDESRHAIERMTPRHYISAPYFERHLTAIATLLIEKGIATREELEALVDGEFPLSGPLR